MATLDTKPQKGFEGLDMQALEDRRQRLATQWVSAVQGAKEDVGDDGAFVETGIPAERVSEVERIRAEFDALTATIKEAKGRKDSEQYAAQVEDLTSGTRYARDRQAKLDAQTWMNILKAGHGGKYTNTGTLKAYQEHPGEVDLGQPAIVRNATSGVNEVMPFPFVPAEKSNSGDESVWLKNLEASFRNAEITAADKQGLFDPVTGAKVDGHNAPVGRERLEAALTTTGSTYDLTTIGGMLYTYMVQENEFISICKIVQSPAINNYNVIRRSAVPNASAVGENGDVVDTQDSTFLANLVLTPRKYGLIRQYSYETTMQNEPWSMSQLVAMDSGIGLRNGIGAHLLTGNNNAGNPGSNQIYGLLTYIKNDAATNVSDMRIAGVSQANFLTGTTFGVPQMAALTTSIPKEYMKSPNKRLVMPLIMWGRLMGLADGERRKLFSQSNMNVDDHQLAEYSVRVLLDENLDGEDGTLAVNEIPILFGDFDGFCVLLAGGPRMDFSVEYAFQQDRLALRTLQHVACGVVDTNAIRGYRVAA